MKRHLLTLALGLASCSTPETPTKAPATPDAVSATLAVSNAYALAAPQSGTSALFFSITGGPTPDTLVAVAFDGATKTGLHESTTAADGMRGMQHLAGIPVPAGGTVALAPGSTHAMLIELARPLAAGDTLSATATFASGATLPVRATVRSIDSLPAPTP